jgi:adenosylcobinamide kinase / adenosylcobinamide-phosphate guanylyltransferase
MLMALPQLTFVLGGARSGKSAYAESLLAHTPFRVYIATAVAFDDEMQDKITDHQRHRGDEWETVEAPINVAQGIEAHPGRPLLLDCLTVWIGNLMHEEVDVDEHMSALVECLTAAPGPLVVVSNEVGLGLVPDNPMARRFRDYAGRLNQRVAAIAPRVVLVTAGIPLTLKDN